LVYEKRLNTKAELGEELRTLDFDAGIRVLGTYEGVPCFIFITKAGESFIAAVYARKRSASGSEVPERRLMLKDYKEIGSLMGFVEERATEPLEAYSY